ncbi:hypothetical protein EVAR_73776_1 [Eumeta japonica]|uniref:Uncharacterized protein n=1 Tax=Eumeta variegata TaxID=151549 RepID=A0A4C2A0L5_EUMVA|nr:hypothetical protein EVAR_73776_1 [Eumeta japonica]
MKQYSQQGRRSVSKFGRSAHAALGTGSSRARPFYSGARLVSEVRGQLRVEQSEQQTQQLSGRVVGSEWETTLGVTAMHLGTEELTRNSRIVCHTDYLDS